MCHTIHEKRIECFKNIELKAFYRYHIKKRHFPDTNQIHKKNQNNMQCYVNNIQKNHPFRGVKWVIDF